MRFLLVVYDNGSYIHFFPQGLGYIAAVLEKEGCEVVIYNQDMNHYSEEHLTEYLNKNKFDFVGVSVIAGYYQYQQLLSISKSINASKKRPFYIIGGHGPTPEPEYFIKKTQADAIVMGEGEETVVELIEKVAKKKSLKDVKGIAYKDGKKVIVNQRRELIKDIDTIPLPAYKLFPMNYYRLLRVPRTENQDFVMPVLSGRGCIFSCVFCYRMDKGFRPRSNMSIIEEIKLLKKDYGINYIAFSDELLMSSVDRTISICKDFIKHKLDIKWDCNGRLNFARPDVLRLMKKSGCVFINYGIEAMDDEVLKNMRKFLTIKQILKGIRATLKEEISPGFNIIFGNIGDNKKTLKKGVEFLLKYDDGSQMRTIRPVTPYPGTPLYYDAIEKGLLKGVADFYEHKHINSDLLAVNFTKLSDKGFHKALLKANTQLITNYFNHKLRNEINLAKRLYLKKDASFRGFRQS